MEDGHQRWLEACAAMGFEPTPRRYEDGTRTSADAAQQLGCEVAQIAKLIVFEGIEGAVVVITSGAHHVDRKKKLKRLLGYKPSMCSPEYVLSSTGYAPGGVPPFGHLHPCTVLMDETLLDIPLVWGAAGSADTVFPITPEAMIHLAGAQAGDVKQERSSGAA